MPEILNDVEKRLELISNCLRANRERQIDRYPAYKVLADMAGWLQDNGDAAKYINAQFIVDILVWYHLAWLLHVLILYPALKAQSGVHRALLIVRYVPFVPVLYSDK
jgi:hypothetical protein